MLASYHRQITVIALEKIVRPESLQIICRANIQQDNLIGQLHPYYHFDNNLLGESQNYIATQRALTVMALQKNDPQAWKNFGRLLHTCQDFYAHSNYVTLWLDAHGGLAKTSPDDIEPWSGIPDKQLHTGHFSLLSWIGYRLPLLGAFVKKSPGFARTHESMNLDHPGRGPEFGYAMAAAIKSTKDEFNQLIELARKDRKWTEIHSYLSACLWSQALE